MPVDLGTMKHKGYAFIEYMDQKAANDSVAAMNRFDIGGQLLRVGRSISLPSELKKGLNPSDIVNKIRNEQKNKESKKDKVTVKPEYYKGTKFEDKESVDLNKLDDTSSRLNNNLDDLNNDKSNDKSNDKLIDNNYNDENNDETISKNDESKKIEENGKVELEKLPDGSLEAEEIVSIKGTDQRFIMMKKLAALKKQKNSVLVLKNMILPDEIDDELEDEIKEECIKYGKILSVLIKLVTESEINQDQNLDQNIQTSQNFEKEVVRIFVEYETEDEANIAKDALNGRYFAGRIIKVEIYDGMKFKYGDYTG